MQAHGYAPARRPPQRFSGSPITIARCSCPPFGRAEGDDGGVPRQFQRHPAHPPPGSGWRPRGAGSARYRNAATDQGCPRWPPGVPSPNGRSDPRHHRGGGGQGGRAQLRQPPSRAVAPSARPRRQRIPRRKIGQQGRVDHLQGVAQGSPARDPRSRPVPRLQPIKGCRLFSPVRPSAARAAGMSRGRRGACPVSWRIAASTVAACRIPLPAQAAPVRHRAARARSLAAPQVADGPVDRSGEACLPPGLAGSGQGCRGGMVDRWESYVCVSRSWALSNEVKLTMGGVDRRRDPAEVCPISHTTAPASTPEMGPRRSRGNAPGPVLGSAAPGAAVPASVRDRPPVERGGAEIGGLPARAPPLRGRAPYTVVPLRGRGRRSAGRSRGGVRGKP